jgi:rubrerythrin
MGKEPLPVFVFGCLSCGKTVAGNEGVCPRCGASFDDVRFECPFCGALISPQQHRCNECGTEFGQFSEDVSETSTIDLDGAGGVVEDHSGDVREIGKEPSEEVTYECPNCGKPVTEKDSECPHCGARFG